MSRFNAAFQRLGGPGAVTWWAFFISLIDRLITVSVQPANISASLGSRISATVLAQLVMFVPLVLLRITLLKDPLRPRPWVALAGFVVADVVRALAVDQLLHQLGGLPLMPALRVFSGFLPTIIPLIVTAYVVNSLRERRRELAALLEVQEQLERSRAEAQSAVLQRNEDLVARVVTVLESELETLARKQPAEAVAHLQRTATDVVRPLSHELATSFSDLEGPMVVGAPRSIRWRAFLENTISARPLPVMLIVLLLSGVFISAAAVFVPMRWALLFSLVIVAALLALSNLLLSRFVSHRGPVAWMALVGAACVITGLVVATFLLLAAGEWSTPGSLAVAAATYVIGVSAGMATVNGVLTARTTVLDETAAAVAELQVQVVRTRQLQWFHQRSLARAVHGPVQSAVTAAAFRLADAAQDGEQHPDLVESVRTDLMEVMDVLRSPQGEVMDLDASLERVVGMWEGVCEVSATVDAESAGRVAADVVVRACVIDIVTDAVSNAVRHAKARVVAITVAAEGDSVRISVRDDGALNPAPGREGLGTALLNECAQSWALTPTGSGHVLTAVLQCSAPVVARAT